MITTPYPLVSFDQLFEPLNDAITLDELAEYRCVGVRLQGRGAYVREQKTGSQIKRKKQWIVRSGNLLFNKLFAWRGAFAIADDRVDGCIASDKFPLYRIDLEQLDARYLSYWLRSRHLALQARQHSRGAAALSKLTLNPPSFWKLWIPLPDLPEQRRIVARLDSAFSAVDLLTERRRPIDAVVQGRRAGVGSEVRLVMTGVLHRLNEHYAGALGTLDMHLSLRPRSGPSFPCSSDGAGIGVIMPSALGGYRYDRTKEMFGSGSESVKGEDLLFPDDVLISRGNKRDQVGLCIVYDGDPGVRTYANLLMKMRFVAEMLPRFARYWIMSPFAVRYIRRHTKGTSPSVQKINQRALLRMPFPANVPLPDQQRWVTWLDTVLDRVEKIERMIRDQHEEQQLLPDALLSASFKGEL